ncbi:MAG: response regulator [Planctomycetota bacterium]
MRFLIVDDDDACRALLREMLSPYGDCDLAVDGSEGVDAFRMAIDDKRPYDLVCLDIMMPGLDGHQVLTAIRQLEQRRRITGSDGVKIIMTTALKNPKHCIRAFEEGCEAFVTKPISEDRLLAELFRLLGELPRCTADRRPTSPAPPATQQTHDNPPPLRILVVDDDGVCRALLKAMLAPYGSCDFAYNGEEAVDAVRLAYEDAAAYDLVCLDIMMPGMNGHDALRAIRELEKQRGVCCDDGVRVIMTTALRDSKHCVQAFREGCESYVTKPVHEEELVARLHELGLLPASAGV